MNDCPNETSNGFGSHNATHPLPCLAPGCDCSVALRRDAERYRWLAARILAADFDYGGNGTQVLIFEMPAGFSVSADFAATIDAAMAAATAVG